MFITETLSASLFKRYLLRAAMAVVVFMACIAVPVQSEFVWRSEPNQAFTVGEKLVFNIQWQFIVVGTATMEVRNIEEVNGRPCYHIVTEARSAAFFDNFFKVRDVNESWMDVESLCSHKFINNISEGNFKKYETLLFDQQNLTFEIPEEKKSGTIPTWVQDVLSALYYFRTKAIGVGDNFSVDAHSGDKSWPLYVDVLRKERIRVPTGTYSCFVLEPKVRENAGIFQAKGRLWVWVTDDARRLPVRMSSKVAIGSIITNLIDVSGI